MTHPSRPAHVELADHFSSSGSRGQLLRVRLTSGEEFEGVLSAFDADHLVLVVTTSAGQSRKIRPAEVVAIAERRPRWLLQAALGVVTVGVGAFVSALVVPLLAPLAAADGALIGALGGAVAAIIVPGVVRDVSPVAYARLLERLGPLGSWRAVFPKADA
jgi:hypothetical protein